MVTSELKDGIVWLTVEGELAAQDIMREAGKWLSPKDAFSGFITDLHKMATIPSTIEQKELEEWRKRNKSGKPRPPSPQSCGALPRTKYFFPSPPVQEKPAKLKGLT